MEKNWDTLAYILISLAIFAISALRKKKPQNQSARKTSISDDSKSLFDIFNSDIESDPVQFYKETEKIPEKERVPKINKEKTIISNNEGESVFDSPPEKEEKNEEIKNEEFDLIKAVIYSEILNRKIF